jgi:hypothetical protein
MTEGGWRWRKAWGSFSACSVSVSRSRAQAAACPGTQGGRGRSYSPPAPPLPPKVLQLAIVPPSKPALNQC